MTRKELAREIAQKSGLSYNQAESLVVALGDVIRECLAKGDRVVYSNFGTFYTVHYPSKVINHPKYGAQKKIIMLPTNVAKWMPSGNIKSMVGQGEERESVTAHGLKGVKKAEPISSPNQESNFSQNYFRNDPENSNDENNNPDLSNTGRMTPASEEQPKTNANVYEELMNDGGREEATFDGVIRLHERKPFWKRIFQKDSETTADSESQGMVGSGIFNKENTELPDHNPSAQHPPEQHTSAFANQPHEAKAYIQQPASGHTGFEFSPKPVDPTATAEPKERDMTPFKAPAGQITYTDLSRKVVPKELLAKIPEKIARQFMAVPVEETPTEMIVGMIDPEDIEARELIKKLVQKTVVPKLATEEDVNHILDQYQGLESEVKEAIEEAKEEDDLVIKKSENSKTLFDIAADDAPAARIVGSLLKRAIRDKASDIHIEPLETEIQVRFRIDGVLQKKITLPKDILSAVVSRVKIMSNLKIDEQRLPQDGRFSIHMDERKVDFRVSSMPTAFGEKVVMRILDKMTGILTVEQLGLEGSGLEKLKNNLEKSHGMILVTGPTGSGKTTTLYALIDRLFAEGVNIVTLEDPIEYQIPGINQSQVNPDIKYTFANGLRSIVRQDPDIIMIGEIRDGETAEMAVQSALTGHIVLSTLHTNDAAGASPRLIDMGVEPFLLTSSANVIIGQRLARKICPDCKEQVTLPVSEIEKIKEIVNKMPEKERTAVLSKPPVFYHGKGCKSCNDSGYTGRLGIFEALEMTEKVKESILKKISSSQIQELAISEGMVTMIQDGIIKALKGMTSIDEVWRVTKD